jgi:selenocysteine lyase/cysteine desulfurase
MGYPRSITITERDPDVVDMQGFRALFPVTRRYAYLAHAAVAPLPTPAREAVVRMARRLSTRGIAGRPSPWAQVDALKGSLARLLEVDPADLALTRNTTEGILIAANGLGAGPGENVVIAEGEFPANVQPWRALARGGVEVRVVPQRDGRIMVADIAAAVDHRTRAVSVSFVEFSTGYRNDLTAIAEVCAGTDALFVVDGIQGVGALGLAPRRVGIDVLASGSHKWMLACAGIGFCWFSARALERLEVADMGWLGVERPEDFLDYDQPLASGARRFETGSWDVLGAAALEASTNMLLDLGMDSIEATILELADHVAAGAAKAGIAVASPREDPQERSGIVILATPWDDAEAVARRLARHRVIVTARGVGIRCAAHAYNTKEELDLLVELLHEDELRSRRARP